MELVPSAKIPDGYMRQLFSGSVLAAAAAVDHDAAASKQPSVTLREWWLATVEGDDQKIAVAGSFRRNQTLYELGPKPIAKRHAPNILESEDGLTILISGSLSKSRTLRNGYSHTVWEYFMAGFPRWWQSCNHRYPKQTNGAPKEHTCDGNIATNENAAASSEAGKEGQRTPVVTLEVRGCCEDTQYMALTEKEAVDEEMPTPAYLDAQNTFSLSTILEEYTCDGDIPTNEDAAASNDGNERYTTPSKEANNVEIGLIAGSPSSTDNAVSEAVDSTPATDRKKTPVACLKNQGSLGGNQHIASNKKPVGRPKKSHKKRWSATRSHGTRSPVSQILWSPLTRSKAISMSISTPEALELKRSRSGRLIVPHLDEGSQSIVYGTDGSITGVIGLDSPAMPKRSELKTYARKKRRTE